MIIGLTGEVRAGQLPVSVTLPGQAQQDNVAGKIINAVQRIIPEEQEIVMFYSVAENHGRLMDATKTYVRRVPGVPAPVATRELLPNIM